VTMVLDDSGDVGSSCTCHHIEHSTSMKVYQCGGSVSGDD